MQAGLGGYVWMLLQASNKKGPLVIHNIREDQDKVCQTFPKKMQKLCKSFVFFYPLCFDAGQSITKPQRGKKG